MKARRSLRCLLVVVLAALSCTVPVGGALGHEYSPRGLYAVEQRVLPNGLRVVLKPRGDARQVSIRVNVGVGQLDFPCGRRETAHFLEHLLFTGTPRDDEAALEARIRAWGGAWNAYTFLDATRYELDIFSGHFSDGLALLHEILTESTVTPEKVELSRDIIRREAGETPGRLRRWTYAHGLGKSARDQWLETLGIGCRDLETPDAITREDILRAWRRHYVPGNMALVIVGAFDRAEAWRAITASFGRLRPSPTPPRPRLDFTRPARPLHLESSLVELLGTEAEVLLGFTTVGYRSPDRPAVHLLERYLDSRVYDALRAERGLSYTPSGDLYVSADAGVLTLRANADLEQIDEVAEALLTEVRALRDSPLDTQAVETLKHEALLESATDYETNGAIADYYVESLHEFEDHGALLDMESAVAAVTAEDVGRAAERYLDPANAVTLVERPMLSYEAFYALLAGVAIVFTGFVGIGARRRWGRLKA